MGNETSEINKTSSTNNKDANKSSMLKNILSRMSTTEESIDDSGGVGVAVASSGMPKEDSVTAATVETNLDAVTTITNATIPPVSTAATTVATAATSSPVPVYYELKIRLKEGRNLAIRDIGGKFYKLKQENLYLKYSRFIHHVVKHDFTTWNENFQNNVDFRV